MGITNKRTGRGTGIVIGLSLLIVYNGDAPGWDAGSLWSPDGRFVLFHSDRDDTFFDLHTLELATGHVVNRTRSEDWDLGGDWSPDGRRIALHSRVGGTYAISWWRPGVDQSVRFEVRDGASHDRLHEISQVSAPNAPQNLPSALDVSENGRRVAFGVWGDGTDAPEMIVFDRILDMCRTSVNVFGDSCGAVIVARMEGEEGILTGPEDRVATEAGRA